VHLPRLVSSKDASQVDALASKPESRVIVVTN